ncbi:MAG: response regulator [Rhodospirillales bacterium]|nr:response regulator [Rhodospirillales bacterium]MBO6787367.1 response regulator [Rhodospirillales bacterium]
MNTYRRHAREPRRCLIVDDSQLIRTVARKIIQEIGLDAEEAPDGYAALDACSVSMPEAILLDWSMPHMNGIAFLKTLRAQPDGARPVVIFCTTEEDAGHIEEALTAGANDYLMKPYDGESLLAKFTQMGLV